MYRPEVGSKLTVFDTVHDEDGEYVFMVLEDEDGRMSAVEKFEPLNFSAEIEG